MAVWPVDRASEPCQTLGNFFVLIDTHLHTREHSAESHLPVRQAIIRARTLGLDALCLTDHDTLGWRDKIAALSKEMDFTLFLGMEYLTANGDFVVFGLDFVPAPMLSAQALLHLAADAVGIAIACHPYRNNGRGIGDGLYHARIFWHRGL